MLWVGFEPTIPASELAGTVHGLDRSATVTGSSKYIQRLYALRSSRTIMCVNTETDVNTDIAETEGIFTWLHGSVRFSRQWLKSAAFLDVIPCSLVGKHLPTKLHGITSQKTMAVWRKWIYVMQWYTISNRGHHCWSVVWCLMSCSDCYHLLYALGW
jgi:hypothetical protein